MNTDRAERLGFTLIEALVVIAIIGILCVIYTPILLEQLMKARQMACRMNLIKIGQAFQAYALDHNGLIPTPYEENYDIAWYYQLQPYLGQTEPSLYEDQTGYFHCPEEKNGHGRCTYAMNEMLTGIKYDAPEIDIFDQTNLTKQILVADAVMLSENWGWWTYPEIRQETVSSPPAAYEISYRHPAHTANALLVDLSVVTLNQQQVLGQQLLH